MDETKPRIIILHGENEFGISQHLSELISGSGEPSVTALNLIRLDGRKLSLEELSNAVATLPMFSVQKMVVVENINGLMINKSVEEKLLGLFSTLPQTTLLVLVEYQNLKNNTPLLKWAKKNKEEVIVRSYPMLRGKEMKVWILERTRALGGGITPDAVDTLAGLVGVDARMAEQEILKLLTYVDYRRPISLEDVEKLNSGMSQVNIFYLVDALGNQDEKKAQGYLRTLLSDEDARSIFGMILRQFRLLLLTQEIVSERGGEGDIARNLGLQEWVARKLIHQSRNFSAEKLKRIYGRLMEMDVSVKSGVYEDEVALETFVAELTFQRGFLFR